MGPFPLSWKKQLSGIGLKRRNLSSSSNKHEVYPQGQWWKRKDDPKQEKCLDLHFRKAPFIIVGEDGERLLQHEEAKETGDLQGVPCWDTAFVWQWLTTGAEEKSSTSQASGLGCCTVYVWSSQGAPESLSWALLVQESGPSFQLAPSWEVWSQGSGSERGGRQRRKAETTRGEQRRSWLLAIGPCGDFWSSQRGQLVSWPLRAGRGKLVLWPFHSLAETLGSPPRWRYLWCLQAYPSPEMEAGPVQGVWVGWSSRGGILLWWVAGALQELQPRGASKRSSSLGRWHRRRYGWIGGVDFSSEQGIRDEVRGGRWEPPAPKSTSKQAAWWPGQLAVLWVTQCSRSPPSDLELWVLGC